MRTMKHWALAAMAATALALAGCGGGGSSSRAMMEMTPQEACEAAGGSWANDACTTAEQLRMNATNAVADAKAAVDAVMDDSEQSVVDAADAAIATAEAAVMAASGHGSSDLAMQKGRLAEKKTSRMMAMDDAADAARTAMAATAAKLHAGIYEQAADATGTNVSDVHAAYNDADTPTTGTAADTLIMVTRGTGTAAGTAAALSEDKDTMVAALHGWQGKRYHRTKPASEGTYEAHVYSHVGDPEEGDPFNEEYTLATADTATATVHKGEVGVNTSGAGVPARVASSRFTQTAGVMEFTLPENTVRVVIPGMYHGVSGNYYCTPTDANTKCSSTVAAKGFTLGGGTWSFKPGTATAKVTSVPDASYASFGWWLHTAADGKLTASAFVDRKGAADAASGIDALNGKATYVGGAAGKYALSSTTGGTNDAGHFTARATLEANFTDNTDATAITGTIDQFMGADGMSRDWSVKLNGSPITDTGGIGEDGDTTADNAKTVWTISGTAATAAGEWTGSLQENGDDDVPAIATGTFYSEYGTAGKMIGAFGANKQ